MIDIFLIPAKRYVSVNKIPQQADSKFSIIYRIFHIFGKF